jgi:hypothetical protein
MIPKFRSKAQMRLYYPVENFELWPEDTFSFCPQCGMDSFELLCEGSLEAYVKCRVCGTLWVIKAAFGSIRYDAVVI